MNDVSPYRHFRLTYDITNMSSKQIIVKAKGGLSYLIRKPLEASWYPGAMIDIKFDRLYVGDFSFDKSAARSKFDRLLIDKIQAHLSFVSSKESHVDIRQYHDFGVTIKLNRDVVEDLEGEPIHSDILGITLYNREENTGDLYPLNTPDYTLNDLMKWGIGESDEPGGLHYYVYLNDPLSVQNPLYTNVMGKAVMVPTVREMNKDHGLYVGLAYGNSLPKKLFYTFDHLCDETLGFLGIFKTKAECEMGGNTERAMTAEKKVVELNKQLSSANNEISKLKDLVDENVRKSVELGIELTHLKSAHRLELMQARNERQLEVNRLQINNDATKVRSEMDKTLSKANLEFTRQRASANNWGEVAKAVGAIATVFAAGYKLCTS